MPSILVKLEEIIITRGLTVSGVPDTSVIPRFRFPLRPISREKRPLRFRATNSRPALFRLSIFLLPSRDTDLKALVIVMVISG